MRIGLNPIFTGPCPPTEPAVGALWYDTDRKMILTLSTNKQWIDVTGTIHPSDLEDLPEGWSGPSIGQNGVFR